MHTETILILLFSVAAAVAIAVRQFKVPYTVALVLTGLALGTANLFVPPHLTKQLLFSVFLPGLLFEAAFHVQFRDLWRNKLTIAALAVPGVAASIALTTVLLTPVVNSLHLEMDFTWQYAMVFGALIAASDPIAVVAVFRSLGAPKRLAVLLEGESLFNDGTAIVFFIISLSLIPVAAGVMNADDAHHITQAITPGYMFIEFVKIVALGGIIGGIFGVALSLVLKQIDDAMIEITLTTIAAYGSFALAEHFGFSGVIAVVVAGLLCGNHGAQVGMSPTTRVAVMTFWEYIAFALNSIVFLLIGLEVHVSALAASWKAILVAYLIVTIGRAVVVYGVSGILRTTRERMPWSWTFILTWGGLRGALPMVLVLSLPKDFSHRDFLVTMTFGVVMISILVHGVTISPVLRMLGIVKGKERNDSYELSRGKLQTASAALEELNEMSHIHFVHDEVRDQLRAYYQKRVDHEQQHIDSLNLNREEVVSQESLWASHHLLLTEKTHAIDAFRQGVLSQHVYEELLKDIDARLLRLNTGDEDEQGTGH